MRYALLTFCLLAAGPLPAVLPDEPAARTPTVENGAPEKGAPTRAGEVTGGEVNDATVFRAVVSDDLQKLHARQYVSAKGAFLANEQCTTCHNVTVPNHVAHCSRADGQTERATYLGLAATPLPPALRKHLRLAQGVGLLVEAVEPDSPAQAAGVTQYDVLEKVDVQWMVNPEQFGALVRTLKSGDKVTLSLIHENEPKAAQATLGERQMPVSEAPANGTAYADFDSDGRLDVFVANRGYTNLWSAISSGAPANEPPVTFLGVTTSSPPPAVAGQLKLATGAGLMVDSVEPGSPAQAAGLEPFDVLTMLGDQRLFNADQLTVLVRNHQPGDQVQLTLFRAGRETTFQATLAQRPPVAQATPVKQPADAVRLDSRNLNVLDEQILTRWITAGEKKAADSATDDVASDGEFLRRSYLDLLGILPTPDDVKRFSDDTRADKRKRLIDELLARPEAISRWKDTQSMLLSDGQHSLTLTSKDGLSRYLVAKDNAGGTLFDGPVETNEQRAALPAALAEKLTLMLRGLERQEAMDSGTARTAEEVLQQVLSVDFQETPLRQVIDTLRERSDGNIVVHWKSLQQAGIEDQAPITLSLRKARLSAILNTVLDLAAENGAGPAYTVQDDVILIAASKAQSKAKPGR